LSRFPDSRRERHQGFAFDVAFFDVCENPTLESVGFELRHDSFSLRLSLGGISAGQLISGPFSTDASLPLRTVALQHGQQLLSVEGRAGYRIVKPELSSRQSECQRQGAKTDFA
jgi:hypothetical protein